MRVRYVSISHGAVIGLTIKTGMVLLDCFSVPYLKLDLAGKNQCSYLYFPFQPFEELEEDDIRRHGNTNHAPTYL
jgi:hypothetical protein